jgi:CDP-4-dehydro-6-deoxyglucose reductase
VAYRVEVQPSGRSFTVEAGQSVLEAALRQGVLLPYNCRGGSCGSCKGRVLEGRVRYPDGPPSGISAADTAAGCALFCQAIPESDLRIAVREVDAVAGIPVRTLPCRAVRVERLAEDVVRLSLKLPDTERLQFLAGQYIEFLLADGRRRPFSLASPPHDDRLLELHIRHVPGGSFTDYVFSELKEKALFRVHGPLGTFFLREDSSRPVIFLAGGTGFAPVKAMVEHALHRGGTRPMHVYWGARSKAGLYLHALASGWAEAHANVHYVPVLSEPELTDAWTGRTGLVHEAVLADFPDLSAHEVYASGSPAMVYAARDAFIARGLPEDQIFSDAFEFTRDRPPASAT